MNVLGSSRRRPLRGLVALGVAVLLCAPSIAIAKYSIVVSSASTQTASKTQLRDMFAGVTLTWASGSKVQVVDQADSEIGKEFYAKFIGQAVNQVRMQWTKLLLSGQAMAPVKCTDDAAVKKAVAANPNAIGYIDTSALDGSVKEILSIE